MLVAIIIFCLAYILIIFEKFPISVLAMLGAIVMVMTGVLGAEEAFRAIDLNVIFLLVGMMIMVSILAETGLFEWIAIKATQLVKGEPIPLLVLLMLATAVFSAFLDNVTTILLIVPVTIVMLENLKLDTKPFIIGEILASNIGGTATLIGDPPNILIGSEAGFSFNDFIINLGPVIIINLIVTIFLLYFFYCRKLKVSRELKAHIMELSPDRALKDKKLMYQSLVILLLVIAGFVSHEITHIEPSIIALAGAMALILVSKKEPEEIFEKVEWPTLFFFMGLFIMVEGLVEVGVIQMLAEATLSLTKGDFQKTALFIGILSSSVSPIIDNIPYTTTMLPLIKNLETAFPNVDALWWSLALGACLGGNATLIGASANVVAANISKKNGKVISFIEYLKYGLPLTFVTIVIAMIYLNFRYLR
ncbi:Arsenic efflux pump protein [Sebaldella termitidis]|jgi:Na+/H+ antiporter NhaD/arsenite permease-like protein|uniref:Citrate transporter n=1 Tax=Sebaldella termitidis (strain ATCC 33386 / NCTC 11300) TaxID=526218 RepID=D1AJY0_SEBTE|nr:ArsB/NhaD family transporter [Sebaldella termitidis]ACZ07037.1 Citrate transporter [Sebaldella termitidis ATCC 33386]SUI22327.1 Arsenic efflux pump protein [Sebaldella termitidis]